MRTCLDRLIAKPRINGSELRTESNFITARLEQCRIEDSISNDAFLDAGVIQGALEMIANHADMGVPQKEVQSLIRQQISRAQGLEEKHPGLDNAVESGR
tara:strand:+ start:1331 stop:1630 length:300 start_codon:yes stop_codon:yes gene_type:complete